MPETCIGFVDFGFLDAAGAAVLQRRPRSVNPSAAAVVEWFKSLVQEQLAGQTFLRTYWYDGAYDPSHRSYTDQRRLFDGIANTPGVQLRLGHIAEHPNSLEAPIRQALTNTANDLSLIPSNLLNAFDRRWTFYPERQQKGVDTLIALDMVRLASRSVYNTAVLIAGDRDLAEAIRTAQDYGARVIIATPNRQSVAQELTQLADGVIDITAANLQLTFPERQPRANR